MTPFRFGAHIAEKVAEMNSNMGATTPTTMSLGRTNNQMPSTTTISGSRPNQTPNLASQSKNTGKPTWSQFGYELGQSFNPWNDRPKGTGLMDYNSANMQTALQSPMGQKAVSGLADAGAWYKQTFSPETRQLHMDMSSNSGRAMGGIINGVAGTVGAGLTHQPAMLANAWNRVAPKSVQIPESVTGQLNAAHDASKNLAYNAGRDLYGAFGGDTNYDTQHSWNQLEQGFNAPGVDASTKNIATAAGWGGHIAGNVATMFSNPGAVAAKAVTKLPQIGSTAGKAITTGGKALNLVDDLAASPGEMATGGLAAGAAIDDYRTGVYQ